MAIINGTAAADALNGTSLGDQINGGDGADVLRGLGGADTLNGGAGADRFFWTAGDGADRIEGGADTDTAFVSGSRLLVSAAAGHALVTQGAEKVDLHGVEVLNLQGVLVDSEVNIGDLSATEVRQVVVQLTSQVGESRISIDGAAAADVISAQVLSGGGLRVFDTVNGVVQTTVISNLEASDTVAINGGGGNDTMSVTAAAGVTSPIPIVLRGGAGNDSFTGSAGVDWLLGDDGDDQFVGGGGADAINGGAGNDTQLIGGTEAGDVIELSNRDGEVRETVNGVTSFASGVETLNIRPLGQGDTVRIGSLAGTAVKTVNVDLSGARGGQDGAADTVILPPSFEQDVSAFLSTVTLKWAPDNSSMQAVYSAGSFSQTINVTGLGSSDVVKLGGGSHHNTFHLSDFPKHQLTVEGGSPIDSFHVKGTAGGDAIDIVRAMDRVDVAMAGAGPLNLNSVENIYIDGGAGADKFHIDNRAIQAGNFPSINLSLGDEFSNGDGVADIVTIDYLSRPGSVLFGTDSPTNHGTLALQSVEGVSAQGLDALDRFVVNVFGDGPVRMGGGFGHVDFHFGSGDQAITWDLPQDAAGRTVVDGGGGSDSLDVRDLGSVGSPPDQPWVIGLAVVGGTSQLTLDRELRNAPDSYVTDLTVDLVSVERLSVSGGSGSDTITINDQSGTSLQQISIDLGIGRPDGVRDNVFLDGRSSADNIVVTSQASGGLLVTGLSTSVVIRDVDNQDHVFLRAGAGNDVINLANHNAGLGVVHVDQGAGSDTMTAGAGIEIFDFQGGSGGADRVIGFRAHSTGANADSISVFNTGDRSLAEMISHRHIFQSGADVVLTDGAGSTLTLANVTLGSLSASDFIF